MGKEFISLKEFLDKEQEVLLIAFALYEHIYLDCCKQKYLLSGFDDDGGNRIKTVIVNSYFDWSKRGSADFGIFSFLCK